MGSVAARHEYWDQVPQVREKAEDGPLQAREKCKAKGKGLGE